MAPAWRLLQVFRRVSQDLVLDSRASRLLTRHWGHAEGRSERLCFALAFSCFDFHLAALLVLLKPHRRLVNQLFLFYTEGTLGFSVPVSILNRKFKVRKCRDGAGLS